jgi:hypothetical protein
MSNKRKNQRESEAGIQIADPVIESRPTEKSSPESQKATPPGHNGEERGLTWQPIFVLVMIGLSVLMLLGKVLGLF